MKYLTLEKALGKFFKEVGIGGSNTTIANLLSKEDTYELITKLSYALPAYPDRVLTEVYNQMFYFIPKENFVILIDAQLKSLFRLYMSGNLNKEKQQLLIFYLSLLYKHRYNDSVSNSFIDVKKFMYSHLIESTEDLVEEIKDLPIKGISELVENDYHLRRLEDYSFITTEKTRNKFKDYL